MTPVDFARALAAALAASLPPGFSADADGVHVTIVAPDGTGATTVLDLDADEAADAEACADAAEAVLSLAQDVVAEALDEPWPTAAGAAPDLPIPGARVDGGSLRLWYGDEAAPVLSLRGVRL